jgi:hypothetical protein
VALSRRRRLVGVEHRSLAAAGEDRRAIVGWKVTPSRHGRPPLRDHEARGAQHLAIRARVPLAPLAGTIQPFPTFSEALFYFAPAELANRIRAGG